jgi:hypothetical protein
MFREKKKRRRFRLFSRFFFSLSFSVDFTTPFSTLFYPEFRSKSARSFFTTMHSAAAVTVRARGAAAGSARGAPRRIPVVVHPASSTPNSATATPGRRAVSVHAARRICVLPGDGIGPEISAVAVDVLQAAGEAEGVDFLFETALIGGAAIDAAGEPFPQATLDACLRSEAVLLAAIGG